MKENTPDFSIMVVLIAYLFSDINKNPEERVPYSEWAANNLECIIHIVKNATYNCILYI